MRLDDDLLLATLLFGGGLLFWVGLLSGQRVLLLGGGVLLGALFAWMVELGSIYPAVLPALAGIAALAWALETNRFPTPAGRALGWLAYVLIVLLLGFHRFPGMVPVPLLETGTGVFLFPPEKMILLWIVPPLVLAPIEPDRWRWGSERPGRTFAVLLSVTLLALVPLALLLDQVRPGWTTSPLPALACELAYNLLFVCVLEESFFRGIVQTALLRWVCQRRWPHADGLGLLGASLLFGLVHLGGGPAFALLATVAGLGYGAVYYWTGRVHYAVLLHFAVNAVHPQAQRHAGLSRLRGAGGSSRRRAGGPGAAAVRRTVPARQRGIAAPTVARPTRQPRALRLGRNGTGRIQTSGATMAQLERREGRLRASLDDPLRPAMHA